MNHLRPRLFVGSSKRLLPVARALAQELRDQFEPVVWEIAGFGLSASLLDELTLIARRTDLSAFIFGADDVLWGRTRARDVPRDNVVFELGIFIGASHRSRAFFLIPEDEQDFHIPSDLGGVIAGRFDERLAVSDPRTCVLNACASIRHTVASLQKEYALSGSWIHRWTAPDGREHDCELRLLQLGQHIRGVYQWSGLQFEVYGEIERANLVTANYRCVDRRQGYSGAIHLVLDPQGRKGSGKWAGWSFSTSPSDVNSGDCRWIRLGS